MLTIEVAAILSSVATTDSSSKLEIPSYNWSELADISAVARKLVLLASAASNELAGAGPGTADDAVVTNDAAAAGVDIECRCLHLHI